MYILLVMRAIPCIVLAGCFGCYTYAPSQPGRSDIGKPVRLVLTDSGARVLSPLVGAEAKTLEGRITSDTGSVYAIRVTRLMRADGLSLPRGGEKMLIPHTL